MLQSRARGGRGGKVLVLVALLLPPMCGMVGLVIDAGVMMSTRRQAQNAADAAALAAALGRVAGQSDGAALVTATAFVQSYNGLPGATVTLNSPPLEGAYAGNPGYVEVIVEATTKAWFIPVVGGPTAPTVRARAVAGPQMKAAKDTLIALDPTAIPGLSVERTTLKVKGTAWVNSQGGGSDKAGGAVNLGFANYGARVLNGGSVQAETLRLVGGVDTPSSYQALNGGPGLKARQLPLSDPLINLRTPTTATGVLAVYPGANGATFQAPQHVVATLAGSGNVTLAPGIYGSITVTGSGPGSVTFQPGIYVLRGGNAAGHALNIDTGGKVFATSVMFYNTGSNYDPATGAPDRDDGNVLGTDAGATFGDVYISPGSSSASEVTSLGDAASPFYGMLLYHRRWNARPVEIYLHNADDDYKGTFYARWSKFTVRDPGKTFCQIIAGSVHFVTTSGNASVTIDAGLQVGSANLVFLVE
ncbi:pilus assembly protein TadG-related protein [Gemmata sp.]|uniref:pilus assembly protein TadG-related protein n=1 Tax=Gemmata sp. TaxID=1914242 RepID=UPI003F711354